MNKQLGFRAALIIVAVICAIPGVALWICPTEVDSTVWGWRIFLSATAVIMIALTVLIPKRKNLAPDYLHDMFDFTFEKNGLNFILQARIEDQILFVDVWFQNKFDKKCEASIGFRPSKGFFLTRAKIETYLLQFECPPCGFGMATFPLAIPQKVQGKKQSLDIAASAVYPDGQGKKMRFLKGGEVGSLSGARDAVFTGLALMTGSIMLSSPAQYSFAVPKDISDQLPEGLKEEYPSVEILWKEGDPNIPLDELLHRPGDSTE